MMEKPPLPSSSRELQCIGKLEIVRPKPVGFLCGSIPVPTDKSFSDAFNSALVPSRQTVSAPRYRLLPTETDLNRPPLVANFPEKMLPVGAVHSKANGDISWEGGAIASNLSRKCEALAVSGLVEYGDEIDVIAPADILKQIFKIPYSKARVSIAVHRVGQTLVLNTGSDVEEGEKLIRRHSNQSKCADQSLFLNFAMHSVRKEACDCPPTHHAASDRQSNSSVLPGGDAPRFMGQSEDVAQKEGFEHFSEYSQFKQDGFIWESKKNKRNKDHDPVKKASYVGEKPRCSIQESEKHRRVGNDEFLRVLFWQFHNFRMLLGSDLLLFSNEKYIAVSLHLRDVTRQVTPLTWLEAWLDNVMASVPELAICYHENGVVQGYELMKTEDIFLLKGISEDGTPAFHPHVVQQNGLSVLRFLQENCKQDPGAYWLYKNAGEDVIQLFDISVIPKNHSSSACEDSSSSLPLIHRGRSDSLFSLGTLLYRIAHRLSLSMAPGKRAKCARFFKQCLDFLDEPDHLVVRAFAHEQFARLILNYEDLELSSESLPVECEITVADAEEESMDPLSSFSEPVCYEKDLAVEDDNLNKTEMALQDLPFEASVEMTLEANLSASRHLIAPDDPELRDQGLSSSGSDESFAVCKIASTSPSVVQTVSDPISSKLAAVHHVSQAIKSLRWKRQLQSSERELVDQGIGIDDRSPSVNFSVCACGDADCIEICDIREWLPTSKLDRKLWKLVLLLGESYLALGQAYKEDGQLHQALKTVELASSVYGSMPQHLEDTKFISSMTKSLSSQLIYDDRRKEARSSVGEIKEVKSSSDDRSKEARSSVGEIKEVKSSPNGNRLTFEQISSIYLFWAKAWTLVGDVYVEFHMIKGKEVSVQAEGKSSTRELRMSSAVIKEVQRLKKKLNQYNQNCSSCSLVNCSCQNDRASSGSSASSSSGDKRPVTNGRKHSKRSHAKSANRVEGSLETHNTEYTVPVEAEIALRETPRMKNGGIFKYLEGPVVGDAEHNLSAALSCYEEARKALHGLPTVSVELHSVLKKKGWICNELGRIRLERKELSKAEITFADAINAFREVSDHTNVILINCNLGHGRRALAEEMVSKAESFKVHTIFHDAYKQALETAKLEYCESLRYYGAAKLQMNFVAEESTSVSNSLRNEVYTQFAHTYLRLGILLAREDATAKVYENAALEDTSVLCAGRAKKGMRKHEISANDAIREALSVYESMEDLCKQEVAFAYYQLACYQRDSCLKFLESDEKKSYLPKGENNIVQRIKQYASLVKRNWQKAMDFYGPKTHPTMNLTILIEISALSSSLSRALHSNAMMESALSCLLEGRHISETFSGSLSTDYPELNAKFWNQLQLVLKRMLSMALSISTNKSVIAQPNPSNRSADAGKLRELYKMSLKSTDLSDLHAMHCLWAS
ncbi:hypothetical protein Dsin_002308 [Dipteronia sinensis]|uniref:EDRF1 N-terminal domain-containing protein n=1 Tax=Dipteronia sinensis TaxID=43782 RepID=A0AAE0B6W8_9ROSI|nr:hypothetical protein Dsin_002308 [Dipteronia sinensis]